jgi:hypothetical protein
MSNGTPPITSAPSPPSVAGIVQPVIESGDSLPPSFPLGEAGTWMPPPQVGMGENEPFPTPVVPPGTGIDAPEQPQFGSGSGTAPTAAALFPAFTAAGPFQPIVLTAIMQIGTDPPPTTPGTQPVMVRTEPNTIPQLPWTPGTPPGIEPNPTELESRSFNPMEVEPEPSPRHPHKRKRKAHG